MADIFISYSSADREFARTLTNALTAHGCTVWWDRDIEHGKYFDRVIEQEIQSATVVMVIWSKAGVESDWCRAEALAALEQNKLIPISIEQAKPPLRFKHIQTGNFSDWRGDSSAEPLKALCRDLKGYGINVSESSAPAPTVIGPPTSIGKQRQRSLAIWLSVATVLSTAIYLLVAANDARQRAAEQAHRAQRQERDTLKILESAGIFDNNVSFVLSAQKALRNLGYMPPSDSSSGKIDSETAQALRRFQTDRNLRVTGSLDTPSLRALVFPSIEKTPEE